VPKFAANLTMLFNEVKFLDRFAAAAAAGFDAVEFMFPYDFEASAIADALATHHLTLVLHNLPAGNWGAGERGIACDPARTGEFRDGVGQAITYAKALDCKRVNCLVGIPPAGVSITQAHDTIVENLIFAAGELGEAGIELLIEPVNTRDIPGFAISRTQEALAILEDADVDNLKIQYDIYHAQVMEGDLTHTLITHLDRIGHIQVADNPGRHEPGTGEINFPFLFKRIDELGYQGFIGCEYCPAGATEAGLGWLRPYRAAA
jgi:hydroxypyruvate isomerase